MTGNDEEIIIDFKQQLVKVYEMTDLRKLSYFLGLKVKE
jgi:hypothetical protein